MQRTSEHAAADETSTHSLCEGLAAAHRAVDSNLIECSGHLRRSIPLYPTSSRHIPLCLALSRNIPAYPARILMWDSHREPPHIAARGAHALVIGRPHAACAGTSQNARTLGEWSQPQRNAFKAAAAQAMAATGSWAGSPKAASCSPPVSRHASGSSSRAERSAWFMPWPERRQRTWPIIGAPAR